MAEIRGLTIYQPWATAIAVLGKDYENRGWKPGGQFVDSYLAIHAGKQWDQAGAEKVEKLTGVLLEEGKIPRGAIVAVARLAGFDTESDSKWFYGPIGWKLADVRPIEPVNMVGARGLWRIPPNVTEIIRARYQVATPSGPGGIDPTML